MLMRRRTFLTLLDSVSVFSSVLKPLAALSLALQLAALAEFTGESRRIFCARFDFSLRSFKASPRFPPSSSTTSAPLSFGVALLRDLSRLSLLSLPDDIAATALPVYLSLRSAWLRVPGVSYRSTHAKPTTPMDGAEEEANKKSQKYILLITIININRISFLIK